MGLEHGRGGVGEERFGSGAGEEGLGGGWGNRSGPWEFWGSLTGNRDLG